MTVTIENTNVDTVLNIAELTTASLTGTGVFDVLLQTLRLHLDREFTSGRITGTAYATVYSQALTAVLQQSVGFCLSKTKLALELQQMQEQVVLLQKQQDQITATIRQTDYITDYQLPADLATKNKQLALLDYDLVNIKPVELAIAQQDILLKTAQAALTSYDLTTIKPQELALLTQKVANETYVVQHRLPAEVADIEAGVALKEYELTDIKPIQKAQIQAETSHIGKQELNTIQQTINLTSQKSQVEAQTAQVTYTTANLLPSQLAQTTAQTSLLTYDLNTVKPAEVVNLTKQGTLLDGQKTVADKQALSIEAETAQVVYKTTYVVPEEVKIHQFTQDRILAEVNKLSNETVVSIKQGRLVDAQIGEVNANVNKINVEVATKLPEEIEILKRNQTQLTAQTDEINYRVSTLLPSQTAQNTAQTAQITYTTSNILPAQLALTTAQKESSDAQTALYEQKVVTETAQAVSTPATGSVMGVQNALMAKQTENYDRDAEQKAAKLMLETINVRFTADSTSADFDYVNHLSDADVGVVVQKLVEGVGGTVAPPPPPTP